MLFKKIPGSATIASLWFTNWSSIEIFDSKCDHKDVIGCVMSQYYSLNTIEWQPVVTKLQTILILNQNFWFCRATIRTERTQVPNHSIAFHSGGNWVGQFETQSCELKSYISSFKWTWESIERLAALIDCKSMDSVCSIERRSEHSLCKALVFNLKLICTLMLAQLSCKSRASVLLVVRHQTVAVKLSTNQIRLALLT